MITFLDVPHRNVFFHFEQQSMFLVLLFSGFVFFHKRWFFTVRICTQHVPLTIIQNSGYKQKISRKRSGKYVTIRIYELEVTWNESVSNSFDITLQQWHTDQFLWCYQRLRVFLFHGNTAACFELRQSSCTDLTFRFFSSVSKISGSMRKETAAFPAHSSKTWKHKSCGKSMFHLKDSLVILSFLYVFILFMNSWKTMV